MPFSGSSPSGSGTEALYDGILIVPEADVNESGQWFFTFAVTKGGVPIAEDVWVTIFVWDNLTGMLAISMALDTSIDNFAGSPNLSGKTSVLYGTYLAALAPFPVRILDYSAGTYFKIGLVLADGNYALSAAIIGKEAPPPP